MTKDAASEICATGGCAGGNSGRNVSASDGFAQPEMSRCDAAG